MTFLQLVQRAHNEAGRQGEAPTTVIGQTGMNQRFVNWILTAYEFVQAMHETWFFRQKEFSFPTVNAQQNYTPAALAYTDFSAWSFNPDSSQLSGIKIYSSMTDEQHLEYSEWKEYLNLYKYGSSRTLSQRPWVFTVKPNMSMDLWPIPDAVYTVSGEYIMSMKTMTANADVPIMPDYHMSLVWKALEYYGAFEGAGDVYAHGSNEFAVLIAKLEVNQLPKPQYGDPLA